MTLFLPTRRAAFAIGILAGVLAAPFFAPGTAEAATKPSPAFCSRANIGAYLQQEGSTVVEGKTVKKVVDIKAFYQALLSESDKRKNLTQYRQSAHSDMRYAGTDAILEVWNESYHLNDPRLLAYVLASAWHETATRMSPVRETLASTDAGAIKALERHYIKNGRKGHYYWGIVKETGKAYFGRGHIQLTWADNYKKADKFLGRTTVASDSSEKKATSYYWTPENVLDPKDSAYITFDGMMFGWYRSGRCLPLYIKENRNADFRGARDIVNGDTGKNGTRIANYAQVYAAALATPGVVVTEEALAQKEEERAKEEEQKVEEEKKEEEKKVEEKAEEVAEERKNDDDKTRMGKIESDLIALGRRMDDLETTIGKATDEIGKTAEEIGKKADEIGKEGEGKIQTIREQIAAAEKKAEERADEQDRKSAELEEDVLELKVTANATHEAVAGIRGALGQQGQDLGELKSLIASQNTQLDLLRQQLDQQSKTIEKIEKCTGLWSSIFGCDTGE